MLVLAIFSLITAVALPSVKISPLLVTRVTSITLLYAALLSFNALYTQALGSGVGIYSGLFQVSAISQYFDTFIFFIGAIILMAWAPVTSKVLARVQAVFTALPTIPEYSIILLFSICGRSLLISSRNLISMYLSIEVGS